MSKRLDELLATNTSKMGFNELKKFGYSKKLVEIRCLRVAVFSCIPK